MTVLYYDPIFLEHVTGNHPENAKRLEVAWRHLSELGLDQRCQRKSWGPIHLDHLKLTHSDSYIERIGEFVTDGGGWIESDTFVCPQSFDVAMMAAGAGCDAVKTVVDGKAKNAFCMIRPPGHHALEEEVMGFCLFNNIAIAAKYAIHSMNIERVLIVDWDVHHGNGTQAIFWEDPQVGFFSIHRYPFYPGTGARSEKGAGKGLGSTVNVPIEFGTSREDYFELFESQLRELANQMRPELILISAGFDAHRADPIGSLGLETEDFAKLSRIVLDVADEFAEGRVVSLLEGGYDPRALAESIAVHIQVLHARDGSDE